MQATSQADERRRRLGMTKPCRS